MTDSHAQPLRIIAGPTASGKSALALEIAERRGAWIVSADSMQVYRGVPIGTAQPTPAELARAPHHLVGHVAPGEDYNVARFVAEARAVIAEANSHGRPVIVAGGTGLFLKHLVEGIFEGAPRDSAVRERLEAELATEGLEPLRARLREVDPAREAQINPNDSMRVVRALEVFETTGVPMSKHLAADAERRVIPPNHYIVLDRPREELYTRINDRVGRMLDAGWLDEARALLQTGIPEDSQVCKALGYRELFRVVRGEWNTTEAAEEIRKLTRNFARRQLSWYRGVQYARFVSTDGKTDDKIRAEVDVMIFPEG